ncbi:MAG: GNAT family N-acetyltransferase [Acidobacteria bacterium]|nr:GNAT family N-acetyltransferase [Acidobacteriota bacterium]
MATSEGRLSLEIREIVEASENEEAFRVQGEVWGFSEADRVPHRLFTVNRLIGGLALGAFHETRMIGFCLAFPGVKELGRPYLHSHMAGVLPEYQNQGVGRRLKLAQRREALSRGFELIEWTFDPLEIRNAYFNIERLGAVIRRYKANAYGITTSRLHGSIPTDRLVAEWRLAGSRVNSILDAGVGVKKQVVREIAVPAEAGRLRTTDPARAVAMQTAVREEFEEAFQQGLTVVGYRLTETGGAYELSR